MSGAEIVLTFICILLAVACAGLAYLWSSGRTAVVRAAALAESVTAETGRLSAERDAARRDAAMRTEQLTSTMGELKAREAELIAERRAREDDRRAHDAVLERERQAAAQQREELEKRMAQAHEALAEKFKSLAVDALNVSSAQLVQLAGEQFKAHSTQASAELQKREAAVAQLVSPIAETLKKTDEKLAEIERVRIAAFAELRNEAQSIQQLGIALRDETGRLTKALSKPEVRGQYGEIQLRRVAELAGMREHCDFCEQSSVTNSEGRALRPDMEVRLPNGRSLAVDAKTNTRAYLEAIEASDEAQRQACLDRFARHVEEQIKALSDKKYWSNYEGELDFVVMFVPGDQFIDAALARKPELMDFAATRNVLLASPSTLIGLLRAVAVGWREQRMSQQANQLIELCRELHDRAGVVYENMAKVGKGIESAGKAYNQMVASVDGRFTVTLRKLEEAQVKSARDLEELPAVNTAIRRLAAAPEGV